MVFFDLMLGGLPISEEEVDFPRSACFVLCLEDVPKCCSSVTPVEKGHMPADYCSVSYRSEREESGESSLLSAPWLVAFVRHPPTYTGD